MANTPHPTISEVLANAERGLINSKKGYNCCSSDKHIMTAVSVWSMDEKPALLISVRVLRQMRNWQCAYAAA